MKSSCNVKAVKKTSSGLFLTVSVVILFSGAAPAGDNVVLALNRRVKPAADISVSGLTASSTGQAKIPCLDVYDFDAFSAVNDPLYREGSKEFLKQVSKIDEAKPARKKKAAPVLRDAPNSCGVPAEVRPGPVTPRPAIKRPKVKKTGPADPLKAKNTL
jgi:hypothetical protein